MSDQIKSKIEHWDKILDEFESKISLPVYKAPGTETELSDYLNMPRSHIEALTADDCATIGYRLNQYAFYLKRTLNREKARANWLKTEITKVVVQYVDNYGGSWEHREQKAINENEYTKKLQNAVIYCQQRIDRLDGLAEHLTNLARQIESVKFAKLKG